MLYDPKWNQVTTPSLAGFIAWLERQPADEKYKWSSVDSCAVAQYLKSTGMKCPDRECSFSNVLGRGWPYAEIAGEWPYTFGAALNRARALTKG